MYLSNNGVLFQLNITHHTYFKVCLKTVYVCTNVYHYGIPYALLFLELQGQILVIVWYDQKKQIGRDNQSTHPKKAT